MPDEAGYEACLLSFEEAYQRVPLSERQVLVYAWRVYAEAVQYNAQLREAEAEATAAEGAGESTGTEGQPPSTGHEEKDTEGGDAEGKDPAGGSRLPLL
jgi:hypothetical protein